MNKQNNLIMIVVHTNNCHEDEIEEVQEYIDTNNWRSNVITESERQGILQLINYTISERINDEATDLGYMGLLQLKNKLQY